MNILILQGIGQEDGQKQEIDRISELFSRYYEDLEQICLLPGYL